jgi:VWFA-related protein
MVMYWKPAAASLLIALSTFAQQPAPQSTPTFRARTELVTVPVIVMRHGEHVTGLKKEDFEIEEEGVPKPLNSFEEVRTTISKVKPVPVSPDVYTNELIADGPPSITVFLLDLINTPYFHQEAAKKRLLDFLQTKYTGDRPTMLLVLRSDGLRVLHDITTDPQVLREVVRLMRTDVKHDPTLDKQVERETSYAIAHEIDIKAEYDAVAKAFIGDYTMADEYQRQTSNNLLKQTFSEIQQLARALSSVRAMKSLVWVTGGITLPDTINFKDRDMIDEYQRTLNLLAAADVTVYPIDTVLETDNPAYSTAQSRYPRPNPRTVIGGPRGLQIVQNFMDITNRTGGSYCLLRKDPDTCFQRAIDFTSEYYMLSYYAQPSEVARWRKLHVKVHGADLQVHARSGYISAGHTDDPDRRRKNDIAQAFYTPVESRGLPISVRWQTAENEKPAEPVSATTSSPQLVKRRPKQPFVLAITPSAITVDSSDHNHVQLDIVAVALSDNGDVLGDVTQQIDLHLTPADLDRMRRKGFAYGNEVDVPPHAVKVRFIVRDDLSERLGTVTAPAPNPAAN